MENIRSKLILSLSTLSLMQSSFAYGKGSCESIFTITRDSKKSSEIAFDKNNLSDPAKIFFDSEKELDINKTNAAWEVSKVGVQKIVSELHGMDTIVYYYLTTLLSASNVLIDGGGGGGKTFSIRKIFEAEMRARQLLNEKEKERWLRDTDSFFEVYADMIMRDAAEKSENRVFTQQMHASISSTKILGGPNPFKVIREGDYSPDYTKALISPKNKLAILDELDKAPVSIQMMVLSILQERQALFGNVVVQTLLESVAATSNTTLGDLIAQALPHEIGGRMAMIDRFPVKVHIVNTGRNATDMYFLLEKIGKGANDKFSVINIQGIRKLISKIQIPKELLDALTEVTLHMDRKYTEAYNEAILKSEESKTHPSFYPSYSGSTRSNANIIRIWQAAFLVRQLMQGVPYEKIRFQMAPTDLVDIVPSIVRGSVESIVPHFPYTIKFVQYLNHSLHIQNTNVKDYTNPADRKLNVSYGYYDPYTQIFQYESGSGKIRRFRFDTEKRSLIITDQEALSELMTTAETLSDLQPRVKALSDVNNRIAITHDRFLRSQKDENRTAKSKPAAPPRFKASGDIAEFLNAPHIRTGLKRDLREIETFTTEFITIINASIAKYHGKKLTPLDSSKYRELDEAFKKEADELRAELQAALQTQSLEQISSVSSKMLLAAYKELNTYFKENAQIVKSIFLSLINNNNLLLSGAPGSGKTLLTRLVFEAAVEGLTEAKAAEACKELAEIMKEVEPSRESVFVKQLHPMSSEGEITGRLDLKSIEQGLGYAYNRTGTLSAKKVLFALIDEFEKAPSGVRMATLSLLNERQLFDGDQVVSSLIRTIVISTNTTSSEFINGLGDFSTGFPVWDRLQNKANAFNKLSPQALREFFEMQYLGAKPKLRTPLFFESLTALRKKVVFNDSEKKLLTKIGTRFLGIVVQRSDSEQQMFEAGDTSFRSFYMNSRGESGRSFGSAMTQELGGNVLLSRLLRGEDVGKYASKKFKMDFPDLLAFAELLLQFNNQYSISHTYDAKGIIQFHVASGNIAGVNDRLTIRDQKVLEHSKYEAEQVVSILNTAVQEYMAENAQLFKLFPDLYPSAFSGPEQRKQWLESMGIRD